MLGSLPRARGKVNGGGRRSDRRKPRRRGHGLNMRTLEAGHELAGPWTESLTGPVSQLCSPFFFGGPASQEVLFKRCFPPGQHPGAAYLYGARLPAMRSRGARRAAQNSKNQGRPLRNELEPKWLRHPPCRSARDVGNGISFFNRSRGDHFIF